MSSGFGKILERVVTALPGAHGAIFVDWEGEAVDEFACIDVNDLKIVGAQWGITYQQTLAALDKLGLGSLDELVLRFSEEQIVVRRVAEGYIVLLSLGRDANLGRALHLLRGACAELSEEMR